MSKLLGHYTNLSALERILQKRELRFGPFDQTNDPFENKNLEFTIRNKVDSDVEYDSSIFIPDGQLKKPFRLLCLSISKTLHYFYKRPRMWSQYADDHRGCCLILDKDALDVQFKSLKIGEAKKSKSIVFYDLDKKENEILLFCRQLGSLRPTQKQIDVIKITDAMYDQRKLILYSKMRD